MRSYILRRLFHSLLVLVGISPVVFIILHLAGDPAALLTPMEATSEQVAQFRQEMGFDDQPSRNRILEKRTCRGGFETHPYKC